MTRIIFVRHGQTDQNLDMLSGESIKELDYPLNETGIAQAEALYERLAGEQIDAMVSSSMLRAKTTAEILNKDRQLPIIVEHDLREREASTASKDAWHELFDMDKNIQTEIGEDAHSFFTRVYAVIDRLLEEYDGQTVMIVAHGGVHHAFHAYFNQLPWKGNLRLEPMKNAEARYYDIKKPGGKK